MAKELRITKSDKPSKLYIKKKLYFYSDGRNRNNRKLS